jgi:hypothetical protein
MAVEAWSMAFHARHIYDMIISGYKLNLSQWVRQREYDRAQEHSNCERLREKPGDRGDCQFHTIFSGSSKLVKSSPSITTLSNYKFDDMRLSSSTCNQSAGTALTATSAHRSFGEPAVESRQSSIPIRSDVIDVTHRKAMKRLVLTHERIRSR